MSLRNLNRRRDNGRVLGTPKTGVLGRDVPSAGDNGPGYLYDSLDLPADALKEVCGYITAWPSAGTLTAYEDSSFTFTGAPDGSYTFQFQVEVEGVPTGSVQTATLNVGNSNVTVYADVGMASAQGATAQIIQDVTISCSVGEASAAGAGASVSADVTISAEVGSANATGMTANVSQSSVIDCTVGSCLASGLDAAVTDGSTTTVSCTVAAASAVGLDANVAAETSIACAQGVAGAAGLIASVNFTSIFARAPAGSGYRRQRRPTTTRPPATQRNYR